MLMLHRPSRAGERGGRAAGVLAALAVAGALALPALAQTGADAAGSGAAAAVSAEVELSEVDAYRLGLLRMRGHLGIARALIRIDAPGADHYMGPAIRETFATIEGALERRNAPVTEDMLTELDSAAGLEETRALPAIESAEQAINGSFAQTGAIDRQSVLDLAEALLRAAVARYGEAVSGNEVADLRQYQTGRGLVTQAEALVRHSTALADAPGRDALLRVVTLIRQAWPGIMPPPIVFDPASVADRLEDAVALMDGMRENAP